jgi:hypothetical protein
LRLTPDAWSEVKQRGLSAPFETPEDISGQKKIGVS